MYKYVLALSGICVAAALVLGMTYNTTKPLIDEQRDREKRAALVEVLPQADNYVEKEIDGKKYYEAYKEEQLVGYAIFAIGDGYAGDITMLVGIDKSGIITGLAVLTNNETPGLGAKCNEIKYGEKDPWFLRQLKGKNGSIIELKDVEAITGATITSKAIVDGVREQVLKFFKSL
ncbi:MAG: RnfABCDGE type electron transport complex subunit G [Candidatus Omnitrophota bacterium]